MATNAVFGSDFVERSADENVEFSVFVPVYNGSKSLPELLGRIEAVMDAIGRSYEVVFMDDGSTDNSWEVITELHNSRTNVCAARHLRNLGYNFCLQHGLEFCKGDFVVTLDDDLQHLPEEIPKLIEKMESEPSTDVVFGAFQKRKHSWFKNLGSAMYLGMVRYLYDLPKDLHVTSFRIIRRRVIDQIVTSVLAEPQAGFMILKTTRQIQNVSVDHAERKHGESGIKLSKMVQLTIDLVLHHTTLPLQALTGVGLVAMTVSAVLSVFYFARFVLYDTAVDGFTTIVMLLLAFGGLTALGIGILGFYLSRVLKQTSYNQPYALRDYLPPKN